MEKQLYWIYKNHIWEKTDIIDEKEYICLRSNKDHKCDDLIHLTYLNEPSILYNIEYRYSNDNIYTFNGDILVAVNPFKKLNIYNDIDTYNSKTYSDLKPHPYYIGKKALDQLKYNENQSILVSGESGAGKTQTTKIIMNYISRVSSNTNISEKILASNPILEAFGNAKTIRNDNSSRFGKFIKLLFNDNNKLIGSEINTYLLEKIRITNVSTNERNFHIFYILFYGLSESKRKNLLLDNIEDYNYINRSNIYTRSDGIQDGTCFNELYNSFIKLDFREKKINNIFKTISAILNLGNIRSNKEILNNKYLDNFCFLLSLNIKEIVDFFTYKYIDINGEIIKTPISEQDFIIMRDTFSQLLYSSMFDNIVLHINKKQKVDSSNFIGILDIFGFEVFEYNGFEQLCINYTNEKLQGLFNTFIFEIEQIEYEKEGIQWENIEYPDNKKIINNFESKHIGLFSSLIEQCILKKGNDRQFYNTIEKNKNSEITIKIRDKPYMRFTIKHYADNVTYHTEGFIKKNRNKIDNRIKKILNSGNSFIKELYIPENTTLKKNNVIHGFRSQLNKLLKVITSTKQHYIRCIKPNDKNICDNLNKDRVLEQLRYCGIMQAIKIAKAGYPIRLQKQEFINKFYTYMNSKQILPTIDNINHLIDNEFEINNLECQLGHNKVFMKKQLYDAIVSNNEFIINKKIIIIQKNIRCWKYNRIYLNLLSKIKIVQQKWREKILHRNQSSFIISNFIKSLYNFLIYKKIREKIIKIQSFFRMFFSMNYFKRIKATIKIQSRCRQFISIKQYRQLVYHTDNAKKIQKQWRHNKNRNILLSNIKKIIQDNNAYYLLQEELNSEKEIKEKLLEEREETERRLLEKQREIEIIILEKNREIERLKNQADMQTVCLNEDCPLDTQTHDDMAHKMQKLYLKLSKTREDLRVEQERTKCNIM